jgi:hypothetical protein
VAVRDSPGNSAVPRQPNDGAGKVVNVTVHHIVGPKFGQHLPEAGKVGPRLARMSADNSSCTEIGNLVVEMSGRSTMNQKVHRNLLARDPPKHIHEPRFDSRAVHAFHHVKDTDWPHGSSREERHAALVNGSSWQKRGARQRAIAKPCCPKKKPQTEPPASQVPVEKILSRAGSETLPAP